MMIFPTVSKNKVQFYNSSVEPQLGEDIFCSGFCLQKKNQPSNSPGGSGIIRSQRF